MSSIVDATVHVKSHGYYVLAFGQPSEPRFSIGCGLGLDEAIKRAIRFNASASDAVAVVTTLQSPPIGEGWRLVDTEHESPELRSEYWDGLTWRRKSDSGPFRPGLVYRSRESLTHSSVEAS